MSSKLLTYFWTGLLAILFLFLTPNEISAQAVINEISPSEEWVELFNKDTTEFSLTDCFVSMGSDSQKVTFSAEEKIGAKSFLVVEKGVTAGWNSNWLNNSGDTVTLNCLTLEIDSVSFGGDVDASSYGRNPDGTGSFFVLVTSTKGSANASPTPSPTPTPTKEPTAKPTPKPTTTPQPTIVSKADTPAPTVKAASTAKPLSTKKPASKDEEADLILGLRDDLDNKKEEVEEEGQEEEVKRKFPLASLFLGFGGLSFIGFSVFSFIKAKKKGYTMKDSNDEDSKVS